MLQCASSSSLGGMAPGGGGSPPDRRTFKFASGCQSVGSTQSPEPQEKKSNDERVTSFVQGYDSENQTPPSSPPSHLIHGTPTKCPRAPRRTRVQNRHNPYPIQSSNPTGSRRRHPSRHLDRDAESPVLDAWEHLLISRFIAASQAQRRSSDKKD